MGILSRHGNDNVLDNKFDNFEERLTRGSLRCEDIPVWLLCGSVCMDCDELVTALRYKGRRILLNRASGMWILHQCPHPFDIGVEEGHPEPTAEEEIDWSERKDIEEEMKREQWPDDPYNYPDVPYVVPDSFK